MRRYARVLACLGAGGPSVAVFRDAASTVTVDPAVVLIAGSRGAGGTSTGSAGAAGLSATTYTKP